VIIILKRNQYLFNIREKAYNVQKMLIFLILLGIALLEFVQVILRYVLRLPLMGIEELLLFPTIWLYFLGSATASCEHSQLKAPIIDVFVKSPKTIKIFRVISSIISFLINCWLTYWAYQLFQYSIQVNRLSGILYIPLIYASSAVFIGILLMGIYMFFGIIDYAKELLDMFKGNNKRN